MMKNIFRLGGYMVKNNHTRRKLSPNDHIDGTAALLDALTVRQKWYGEIGEQLKNRG